MKTPTIKELSALFVALKPQICDDYRAFECEDGGDTLPSMQVTVGWSEDGSWDYQTGDNSFSGAAYHHRHWAVIALYRRSNTRELARDCVEQLKYSAWYD